MREADPSDRERWIAEGRMMAHLRACDVARDAAHAWRRDTAPIRERLLSGVWMDPTQRADAEHTVWTGWLSYHGYIARLRASWRAAREIRRRMHLSWRSPYDVDGGDGDTPCAQPRVRLRRRLPG